MINRREFLESLAAVSQVQPDWIRSFSDRPPFSFVYGGRPSSALLPGWKLETRSSDLDAQRTSKQFTYTDPQTGLAVTAIVTQFHDFPAFECLLKLRNNGPSATPILENVFPLDMPLSSGGGDPVIHYAKGAVCSKDDYMPLRRALNRGGRMRVQPGGGRSSSDFLPFFNVDLKGGDGVVIGIGWSGEWVADFSRETGPGFRARAGMADTHLRLNPGEEIRTPLVLTLFWQGGGRLLGHNLLRRFILKHHRPRVEGRGVNMPLCNGNWGAISARNHLANIRQIVEHGLPMDYYWIDAEWFGKGKWHLNPGDWRVKQDLYPEGFQPISQALRRKGLGLLLWFEPERVCEGTPWDIEHRGWLLEVPKPRRVYNWGASQADPQWVRNESYRNQIVENDRLFNLGNPDARRFLTDFISGKIDEFGIGCYRHDANIAPLEFWRAADAPERRGITEIRWVEGLYAFWDELLRRHPRLIIDNCASGGRRIDLESLGRALPLWRTDFPGDATASQCHSYGLHLWCPMNAITGGDLSRNDTYFFRSGMSSGVQYSLFGRDGPPREPDALAKIPFSEIRRTLEQYRSIQKYFLGDFYPLTQYTQAEDAWMVYQLDLPGEGEGLVVALKRPLSPLISGAFPLHALEREARYELADLDGGERQSVTGARLLERGIEISLADKPASRLIRYRRSA